MLTQLDNTENDREIDSFIIDVPAGQYYKLTVVNATIGTVNTVMPER